MIWKRFIFKKKSFRSYTKIVFNLLLMKSSTSDITIWYFDDLAEYWIDLYNNDKNNEKET
jgi:hypothetical protein